MKRLLLTGIITFTLFSGNVFSSEEPDKGRFSFQARKPYSVHFFNVRVLPYFDYRKPYNSDALQIIGANVYWKTKGYDPNKGRLYSQTQANLPLCDYVQEKNCRTKHEFGGSSEHLEGLVWTDVPVSIDMGHGSVPNKKQRVTRFFHERFLGRTVVDGVTVPTGNPLQGGSEDQNVQLSSVYFAENSEGCGTNLCGGTQGEYGKDYSYFDIYIPSNDLEYLVIEVIGFQYNNEVLDKNDGFYTFPVTAVKYVSTGSGKMMKVQRANDRDPSMADYIGFTNSRDSSGKEIYGYFDSNYSNIQEGPMDFENIDRLDVMLKYNPAQPDGDNPLETGIGVDITKKDFVCDPYKSSNCSYPTKHE